MAAARGRHPGAATFRPEVTSAIIKTVYAGKLPEGNAKEALDWSLGWPVNLWPESPELQRRAYDLATRFNSSRAYDAQYLVVAELMGCELWTTDRRLYNSVRDQLPWVRWVEEEP